jgi:hypothetical protein
VAIDRRHLETIARILETIQVVEHEPVRAMLACEDAIVALRLGLRFGLTLPEIAAQHDVAMASLLHGVN